MSENLKINADGVKDLLKTAKDGSPYPTIDNAVIVFRNDPFFKGNIKLNLFRDRIEFTGEVPWKRTGIDISELDDVQIRYYTETTYRMDDLRLLLSNGWEAAQVKDMLTIAKRNYVMSHHDRQIFRLPPSKNWKNGCFKTYVYVDSRRKEITASTNDILYEKLYSFYKDRENKAKTLEEVFDMFADYKQSCLNRSDKTISADYSMFSHVSKEIRKTAIRDLTDEHVRRFIVSDLLPKKPKPAMLKRLLQLPRAVFEYGIRNKLYFDNPLKYIVAQDYYKYCDQSFKTNEEKAFSEEELAKLASDAENNLDNPRVLMALLAAETGMRIGE